MLGAILILCGVLALLWCNKSDSATPQEAAPSPEKEVRIGIAWRADTLSEFYTNVVRAVKEVGATPVLLAQVVPNGYQLADDALAPSYTDEQGVLLQQYADGVKTLAANGSNVAEAVADVQAVIFTGGEDISPTLLRQPEPWHGIEAEKDYSAERDVSDFVLMSYCLEHDIPLMAICRSMQMLSVVSGAEVVQDLPTWFASQGKDYRNEHKQAADADGHRDFAPNDVQVEKGSILYGIVQADELEGCPCWHHQAVANVGGTRLAVTARTTTEGVSMIEAVERTDKTYAIGVQFHPEISIQKKLDDEANRQEYLDYDTALALFKRLQEEGARQLAEDPDNLGLRPAA